MDKKFKDSRAIDPKFLDELSNGQLKPFVDFVKKHPDLELCFRGNDSAVTIYKNNHVVWNIKMDNSMKFNLSFDFNHARFSKSWENYAMVINSLKNFDFQVPIQAKWSNDTAVVGNINTKFSSINEVDVEETYNVIELLLKDYFDCSCWVENDKFHETNWDYFRLSLDKTYKPRQRKKRLIEKRYQQYLFSHLLNGVQSEYFAYDLEFSQPYPSTKYKKDNNIKSNEPDILAVKYEDQDNEFKLVLIEIKSTSEACEKENSGVIAHLEGMKKYLTEEIYGVNVMDSRRNDVLKILKDYKKLELRGFTSESNPGIINHLAMNDGCTEKLIKGVEILFVFTNIDSDIAHKVGKTEDAISWIENIDNKEKLLRLKREIESDEKIIEKNGPIKVLFKKYNYVANKLEPVVL